MEDEVYKICMMCSRLYEGDVKTYKGANVSHGVCDLADCRSAYVLFCSGGDEKLALEIKGGLERKLEK